MSSDAGGNMTDDDWGFQVKRVDLVGLDINAGRRLGVVVVQPEYDVEPDGAVPFRLSDACREAQKDLIEKAFRIRAAESERRNAPVPFVLFPEYSIPVHDPDGLDYLRQQVEQVQGDVVFLGGLEGLSPETAHEVAGSYAPDEEAARPIFGPGPFVNVCAIVVKTASGQLSWHFQAKLRPFPLEQPRNMAHGQRVLYFVAPNVSFLCQICFDHIAVQGSESINTVLCRQIVKTTERNAAILDFVFVPQCNEKPDHPSVGNGTDLLLTNPQRTLKNETTTVIVVNRAASVQQPSEYGRSGCHYRAGRWGIPKSDMGPRGYELYAVGGVTSAVFRKRTQAIHVATLVPPLYNIGNSGSPRQPLEHCRSYLISGGCDPAPCACLPGTSWEVGTFVECDCLPCKLRDALLINLPEGDQKKRWQGSDEGQSDLLKKHYHTIRKNLLMLSSARARALINLLLNMHAEDERSNPDLWVGLQSKAAVELLSALSVLAELQPVGLDTARQWTAWLGPSLAIAVCDGADRRYSWTEIEIEYRKKFKGEYYHPEARQKPVLLMALRSRGLVRPLVSLGSTDITEPTDRNMLGRDDSFARPAPLRLYVCQDTLLEGARQAQSIAEFLKTETECVFE